MLDEILDFFSEIPDHIMELPSTLLEVLGDTFEGIGEISFFGLAFGVISFMFTMFTSKWTLDPFISHMGSVEGVFWMVATYIGSFVAGYLMGKFFENTG